MLMYIYRADVIRVVDGDTVWLQVDCGFDLRMSMSVRLYGINAPEVSTEEGKQVREWLTALIPPGTQLTLTTIKDRKEKYGRYLATLTLDSGLVINEELLRLGYAVEYLP